MPSRPILPRNELPLPETWDTASIFASPVEW